MTPENYNEVKGALGAVLGMSWPVLSFLGPLIQIISGVGGIILLTLSIRHKIIQIRSEKEKLNKK